jgi:hypothetical protein
MVFLLGRVAHLHLPSNPLDLKIVHTRLPVVVTTETRRRRRCIHETFRIPPYIYVTVELDAFLFFAQFLTSTTEYIHEHSDNQHSANL